MTKTSKNSSQSCGSDLVRGRQRIFLWDLPVAIAVLGWLTPWRWVVWAVALFWMGMACLLNARGCGRVHCTFTGPLFLVLGLVALARILGWISPAPVWLWSIAAGGTIAAFVPEWCGKRYWSGGK